MKLVLIADTHSFHDKVVVPKGDVLIHAGDLTLRGDVREICEAGLWLQAMKRRFYHVIVIAGNHDWLFEKNMLTAKAMLGPGVVYLQEDSVEIDGVHFYGSPYTPRFYNWAFNVDRGAAIRQHWDKIPENTDVLITHGPPSYTLDQVAPVMDSLHTGCEELLLAVKRVRPRIHVFGHIHGGYGYVEKNGTKHFNASVVNEAYKVQNKPFEVEIEARKK